jgi:hypothetical protein
MLLECLEMNSSFELALTSLCFARDGELVGFPLSLVDVQLFEEVSIIRL